MFTGIVEARAQIKQVLWAEPGAGARIVVERPRAFGHAVGAVSPGDSISINGACLTLESCTVEDMQFFISGHTLAVTGWEPKLLQVVNMERACTVSHARLGGHMVTGHADGGLRLIKVEPQGEARELHFALPTATHYRRLIMPQGSVCLNGVSLTVAAVKERSFSVCVVPHTLAHTNLGGLKAQDSVVVEYDREAKFCTHQARPAVPASSQGHTALVEDLVQDMQKGQMVILVDDEARENEGDLVIAAQFVSAAVVNFILTHARGMMCLAMAPAQAKKLKLPLMIPEEQNQSAHKTAFTLSFEAAKGVSTGISAADRARSILAASNPRAVAGDVISPGHMFGLIEHSGGVLARAGHTEASLALARLAGLEPACVICEVLLPSGEMARLPELMQFGAQHGIKVGRIDQIIEHLNVFSVPGPVPGSAPRLTARQAPALYTKAPYAD